MLINTEIVYIGFTVHMLDMICILVIRRPNINILLHVIAAHIAQLYKQLYSGFDAIKIHTHIYMYMDVLGHQLHSGVDEP